jgi:Zn2+/Cd2+-exporting ATPase
MSNIIRALSSRDLLFSFICGLLLLVNRVVTWTAGPVPGIDLLLAGSYFFGGYYTAIEVVRSLRDREFNIDLLMLIAAIGAAIIGAYAEGALLLFLFSLGGALEHQAMDRARSAISSLSELAPEIAHRLDNENGDVTDVPVEELVKGDRVLVKPGERFPADGYVLKGQSAVNQAPITGESIPVDKAPVDPKKLIADSEVASFPEHVIFAGSINGDGSVEMVVTGAASDSTLARVIRLINEAEKQKSPTQRFATSFEKWFVPAVLIFVTLISFAFLVLDEAFSTSFYRAMTVLVGASPCALAISTPSAILSGIARSAKLGILIKGGGPLEEMGLVKAIAFDKTGTLTEGRPRITDVISLNGSGEDNMLRIAAAAEKLSDHPIANAIVRDALARLGSEKLPEGSSAESVQGKGLKALVDGRITEIGKAGLFDNSIPESLINSDRELMEKGRTTVVIRYDGEYLGLIGLMDVSRPGSKSAVQKLRDMGISRLVMLTGDNQTVADAIARETGLDEAVGDLLPEDKLDYLKKMVKEHAHVAMIGDGVNDAPALAGASVGIAMGAAGSDVALETADVALMSDDINKLPTAIALSRSTRRIIKQNIFISLGMIAFLVPAALFGFATMGIAVFLHEGSTLTVVLNALRLLGWKEQV